MQIISKSIFTLLIITLFNVFTNTVSAQSLQSTNIEASIKKVEEMTLTTVAVDSEFSVTSSESFTIENIENYPDSELVIYDRNGNEVFRAIGYKNDWNGLSGIKSTVEKGEKLPEGTYLYELKLNAGDTRTKSSWLFITE